MKKHFIIFTLFFGMIISSCHEELQQFDHDKYNHSRQELTDYFCPYTDGQILTYITDDCSDTLVVTPEIQIFINTNLCVKCGSVSQSLCYLVIQGTSARGKDIQLEIKYISDYNDERLTPDSYWQDFVCLIGIDRISVLESTIRLTTYELPDELYFEDNSSTKMAHLVKGVGIDQWVDEAGDTWHLQATKSHMTHGSNSN
ncbi:MAG: hypothetical protein IJ680_07275 [Paludibacteraceae bacterium]|nr:hypothetical protein [Paludibacteraceae bacterium]